MTAILNQIAQNWFNWQISMFWQVGILIVIVAGLDLVIRKWAWPQVRYALWFLILVKLVLPPTLTSPTSFTAEIPFMVQRAAIKINQPQDSQPSIENKYINADIKTTPVEVMPKQIEIASPEARNDEILPLQGSALPLRRFAQNDNRAQNDKISWKAYVLFIWAGGVVILSGWLIIRLRNLRREHLKDQSDLPERLKELLASTAGKLGLKKVPQIILTNKVCCPAVFGVFRPVLLMPSDKLQNMTMQDAEHIFLHELAHIKRGDLLAHAVYMILQIAYWFNPLLWLTRKHLQNLRELCCDATVARMLREKTAGYRQTLLETARQLLAQPVDPGLGLLGLFENSSWLVDRLHWLEKKSWRYRPLRIATIFVMICVMSACVLPMTKYDAPVDFLIKGTVIDAQTGKPIAGAKVGDTEEYADGRFGTTTDSNGDYSYKTWYEEHGIKAIADGYQKERKTLLTKVFSREKEKVINFNLKATENTEIKQESAGQDADKADERVIELKTHSKGEFENTQELSAPFAEGSTLVAEVVNGTITVTGSDVSECKVVAKIKCKGVDKEDEEAAKQVKVNLVNEGGKLVVKTDLADGLEKNVEVNLNITIPRKANLNCNVYDGRIAISNIKGSLEAEVKNGTVKAINTEFTDKCDTNVDNGGIAFEQIRGNAHYELGVKNGKVKFAYAEDAGEIGHVEIDVVDGKIEFISPANMSAKIEADAANGEIRTSLPLMVKRENEGASLDGTLGSGKGHIELSVKDGTIKINAQDGRTTGENLQKPAEQNKTDNEVNKVSESSAADKNANATRALRINIYEGNDVDPQTSVRIPLVAMKIIRQLLPPKEKLQIIAQKIKLDESLPKDMNSQELIEMLDEMLKKLDQGVEPTTLLEVKDGNERIVIALE